MNNNELQALAERIASQCRAENISEDRKVDSFIMDFYGRKVADNNEIFKAVMIILSK